MNSSLLCDKSTKFIPKQDKLLPSGVWPVVLTPFHDDGQIDWPGYENLLNWYVRHDCAGLFAVCLSSELYLLSPEERLELACQACRQVEIPVVAAGYLGNSKSEKMDSIKRMVDTGVDTVIIPVCQLVPEAADETTLIREIDDILSQTGDIPLGLYECPDPYHRLLSSEILKKCAETGRFKFLKDTCCDSGIMKQKIAACFGTPLKIYNAYIHNLLDTLRMGVVGFNGLAASFYPELLNKLIRCYNSDPETAVELQQLISVGQCVISNKYPSCAKYFLKLRGVDIGVYCRNECPELTTPDIEILKAFKALLDKWNYKY